MADARDSDTPDSPGELDRGSWWAAVKRTVSEFRDDNLNDWAAALTYYGILALFPALLALARSSDCSASRPRRR